MTSSPIDSEASYLLAGNQEYFNTAEQLNVVEIPLPDTPGMCPESLLVLFSPTKMGLGPLFSTRAAPAGHGENFVKISEKSVTLTIGVYLNHPDNKTIPVCLGNLIILARPEMELHKLAQRALTVFKLQNSGLLDGYNVESALWSVPKIQTQMESLS